MSDGRGPVLLLGQGEQYDDPEDWRDLIRAGRLRRGMDVSVREGGRTAFRPIEDVPALRALLDAADPPAPREPTWSASPGPVPAASASDPGSALLGLEASTSPALAPKPAKPPEAGATAVPAEPLLPDGSRVTEATVLSSAPAAVKPMAKKNPILGIVVAGLVVGWIALIGLFSLSTHPTSSPSSGGQLQVDSAPTTTTTTDTTGASDTAPTPETSHTAQPEADAAAGSSPATGVTTAAAGPSFDCAKAGDWSARQVCASPDLAGRDRRMAGLYASRMAGAPTGQALALRIEQRGWIARRKGCETDAEPPACLKNAYDERLAELADPNHEPPPVPPASDDDAAPSPNDAPVVRTGPGRGGA